MRKLSKDQLRAMFARLHAEAGRHLRRGGAYLSAGGEMAGHVAKGVGRTIAKGGAVIRNAPVESLAHKAVDVGFMGAEALLHHHAQKRILRLEEIAAGKLGRLQAHVSAKAALRARALHKRYFAQPSGEGDLKRLRAMTEFVNAPTQTELAQRKRLRTQLVEWKLNRATKDLFGELTRRGRLEQAMLGFVDPATLTEIANRHGIEDRGALIRLNQRLQERLRGGR